MRRYLPVALSTCLAAASSPSLAAQLAGGYGRGLATSSPVALGGDPLATIKVNTPDLTGPDVNVGQVDAGESFPVQAEVLARRELPALPAAASRDVAQPTVPTPAAGNFRPSPAPADESDLKPADSPAENGEEQPGGEGPPVLSELEAAAAGKMQPAELYDHDQYGRPKATAENDVPLFYSFLHGRRAGDAPTAPDRSEPSETAPPPAPEPAPAADLAELVDALERRVRLDAAQRAALTDLAAKAMKAKDMDLLANLTFLSVHDSPSKAVLKNVLLAMAFDDHAKWILSQETRFALEPIGEGRRAKMAAEARAAAARYQQGVLRLRVSGPSIEFIVLVTPLPNALNRP